MMKNEAKLFILCHKGDHKGRPDDDNFSHSSIIHFHYKGDHKGRLISNYSFYVIRATTRVAPTFRPDVSPRRFAPTMTQIFSLYDK